MTLELAMSRIDPWSLLALKSARTPSKDGRGTLELARFALAHGLPAEAARRFRRAAELDATLAPDRDAGLRAVRDAELAKDLGAGRARPEAGPQRPRARDRRRRRREGRSGRPARRARDGARRAGGAHARHRPRSAARSRRRRARTRRRPPRRPHSSAGSRAPTRTIRGAIAERAKAGDAALPASNALRALESAEAQFREGRRVLASTRVNAGTRTAEVDGRDKEALALLVATQLDLADLYRQQRRFERARDYLRAAQVLDPENVRIREIRELVERDLAAPPPYEPPPYDPFTSTVLGRDVLRGHLVRRRPVALPVPADDPPPAVRHARLPLELRLRSPMGARRLLVPPLRLVGAPVTPLAGTASGCVQRAPPGQ